MADEPPPGPAPRGARHRHGARHPAGAEEDWELSSDDERAAGAAAVLRGGGAGGGGGAPPGARAHSLADIAGYPTFDEDLPALLDLSLWRQGVLATRAAALVTLMALLAYSFVMAPAGLPSWADEARLLVTLGWDNAVLFAAMGAAALQALLVVPLMLPAMRSANKVPLWPFLLALPVLGCYALLPYFALYKCPRRASRLPPGAAEMHQRGAGGAVLRIAEGRALPALALAALGLLAALAGAANAATWGQFRSLLAASHVAHIAVIDLQVTAVIAALAARRDARLRGARGWRLLGATALAAVPLAGPAVYLLLRPAAAPPARRAARRGVRRARAAEPAGAADEYPPPPAGANTSNTKTAGGGAIARAARVARELLVGIPYGAAVFVLSIAVVLMPSRAGVRRGLAGAKRRVRRVASFVFQGTHVERERVPVRQFSVRSDTGVQEDSDPDHPNALAAETIAGVERLQAEADAEEERELWRGRAARGGRNGTYDVSDDEAAERDEEEEEEGEEAEEEVGTEEVEDGEGTEEIQEGGSEEEVIEARVEARVTAVRRCAQKGASAAAPAPATPAPRGPRGGTMPSGGASPAGAQRASRVAKQAAIEAIHQLAASSDLRKHTPAGRLY